MGYYTLDWRKIPKDPAWRGKIVCKVIFAKLQTLAFVGLGASSRRVEVWWVLAALGQFLVRLVVGCGSREKDQSRGAVLIGHESTVPLFGGALGSGA